MTNSNPNPQADVLPAPEAVSSQFDLTGSVALITGGASGLGRAIAWGLACHGADLVIADLDANAASQLAERVRAIGRRALAIGVDVTDEAQVENMAVRAAGEYGHIDISVNNAGNNCRKPILEMSVDEFDRVVDVHLRGTFLCARALGRGMVERRKGKMINLGSIMGHVGGPRIGPYSAAKGAILQLTKVLALEWAPYNVQVNAISPAHFDTPLTRQLTPEMRDAVIENNPQHRFAFPVEIIGAAVLLASPASSFITGTSILVDGGWTAR
jgi:NAD(P)-dependent dehydrogenase (short-subunit alcohol dehydrogenase family)